MPPQSRLPRAMWRFDVDLDGVADLTDAEVLAGHGINSLQPTRRQWSKTQPIGEGYWRRVGPGVLVPSAAHAGGRVLVVFRPTDEPPVGVSAKPRPRTYAELPPLPTGLRT